MILFTLIEGWRSFRTLGIGGLLTLVSLTVTLALGAFTAAGVVMLRNWQKSALEEFEIEAFLMPEIADSTATYALKTAEAIDDIIKVRFVSREDAAERYKAEVGGDLMDVLGYNPLPPSIIVTLSGSLSHKEAWTKVATKLQSIPGVDEVIYQGDLLQQLEDFYERAAKTLGLLIGGGLTLSLIFTGLTVAAAIRSRHNFIQIVLMCGGSRLMARGPFIALGGYYGAVAGIGGIVFAGIVLWLITIGWELSLNLPVEWAPLMIGAGVLIGATTAGWVAGRKIRTV